VIALPFRVAGKARKLMNLKEAKDKLKARLLNKGFTIHEYNAYSTQSMYLKLDYGVCNTIRISDHSGKKHLKYMYNMLAYVKSKYRIKHDNYTMYFYPMTEEGINILVKDILNLRRKRFTNSEVYNKLLLEYKEKSRYAKGFWTQAVLAEPQSFKKEEVWNMLSNNTKNILECSSAGDKRFSAFYAVVKVFGYEDTIENHYQACKQFKNGSKKPKGQCPDSLNIYGIPLDIKYLTAYYKLLWYKYLRKRRELITYASAFDDFHDKFKGGSTVNCQADVIKQFIKEGPQSILNEQDVAELLEIFAVHKQKTG
jgi:hypothetical protein